jgi:hypothetical protein
MRACPSCGTLEERRVVKGKETVNLDPISGKCIDCLSGAVHTFRSRRVQPLAPAPVDARMAQAGRDGD